MTVRSPAKRSRMPAPGFSLIELVVAMLASTVLVASLGATVMISSDLLQTPPGDRTLRHDRAIVDRVAADLRYATSVDDTESAGFQLVRLDPAGGVQSVTYESYLEGFTRRVDGRPSVILDPAAPAQRFFVDGYTAPTYIPSGRYARVRSSIAATTSGPTTSLDIDVPPGCRDDDLVILCVSSKYSDALSISDSSWQPLAELSRGDLRMISGYQFYDSAWPSSVQITASPASAMAAAMVVIENVYVDSPLHWVGTEGGYALTFLSISHPTLLEPSELTPYQLNVQMFASDREPWIDGALGLSGFVDVVQGTAAADDFWVRHSVGITVRNGAAPEASAKPRLLHRDSGHWLQTAVVVEAAP